MDGAFTSIWLIPLLPGLGALANGLLGKRLPKALISLIACGTVLASFLLSVAAVWQLRELDPLSGAPARIVEGWPRLEIVPAERRVEVTVYEWIDAGFFKTKDGRWSTASVPVAYQLDPLSAVMLMVVTGVGFLIHVYSIGYMGHDKGYYRYFSYLNLFMFSMLHLVMGSNFLVMFVGWEGVGLCSYLLIGYYFDKDFAATAGKKAFVVNRIGDFGFILGLMAVWWTFGTIDFSEVMAAVKSGDFRVGDRTLTAVALLLFLGACGKSAQIPLYVWLPDAMAGPTPVSALIHAATMVTSGIYMIVRCNPIYQLAPEAMLVVAVVAAATAILAASIGLAQNDIKKVLAYSTVSQLGYMFLALGVGAFTAGIFHLMTHAFFKGLLFLGSGSVIHAMSGEQDIWKMGGLRKRIPTTFWTFAIGCCAIAGFPPLLVSGFYSKDEILWKTFDSSVLPNAGDYLWAVGFVTAGMTAFYMFRLLFVTFLGECRADEQVKAHIHESPRSMTIPLVVLAMLSIVGGFVGIPHSLSSVVKLPDINYFEHWMRPVIWHHGEPSEAPVAPHGEAAHGAGHEAAGYALQGGGQAPALHEHEAPMTEYLLMGLTILLSLGSIGAAYRFYVLSPELPGRLVKAIPRLYRWVANKYYVDEFYEWAVVRHMKFWCGVCAWFDLAIIDGIVNLAGALSRGFSSLSIAFDVYVVDFLVNFVGYVCEEGSYIFRRLQTGYVQNYIFLTVFAVLGLLGVFLMRSLQYVPHGTW